MAMVEDMPAADDAEAPAAAALLAKLGGDGALADSAEDLAALHLQALNERFQQRRRQIRILEQRARDVGVDEIASLADIVPLLFSHQTYKSYPETFLTSGRWDRMSLWLDTLSVEDVRAVDVSGVTDVDGWVSRLEAAGHHVRSSSGTSGKGSFLNWNDADLEWHRKFNVHAVEWQGVPARNQFNVFVLAPNGGPHRATDGSRVMAGAYARPGGLHHLYDRPATISEINRMGALRKAMVDGTITPQQLAAFEADAAVREAETAAGLARLAGVLAAEREVPAFVRGTWGPVLQFVEAARAAGIPDGGLAPGSVLLIGGGAKGAQLPADYREQVEAFFAGAKWIDLFGMSEVNGPVGLMCSEGRRHVPAYMIPLRLEVSGERLMEADEDTPGRLALFDVSLEGRWGGVITSDEVRLRHSGCACGRKSTTLEILRRYTGDEGGDDKLTCAGTIAAYVRGAIET